MVITIMGVLAVTSVVYYKSLTSDKMLLKAKDSIQSLLRTAQSNATSGFTCGTAQGAVTWSVKFENETTLKLSCNPANEPILVRTLILENDIKIESTPVTVFYSPLLGKVLFKDQDEQLIDATELTITLKKANTNCITNPDDCESFIISRGGAINAQ